MSYDYTVSVNISINEKAGNIKYGCTRMKEQIVGFWDQFLFLCNRNDSQ